MEKSLAGVEVLPETTVREGLALSDKATPRPWQVRFIFRLFRAVRRHQTTFGLLMQGDDTFDCPDAEYIVHSVTHYPALASEVLARRKAMEDAPHSKDCPMSTGECAECGYIIGRLGFSGCKCRNPRRQCSPDCWKAKWSAEREGE